MTETARPTPGPWTAILRDYGYLPTNAYLAIYGGDNSCVAHALVLKSHWELGEREHPVEANANLIAEAGTVLHETGLSPRQLADQRAELLAALRMMVDEKSDYYPDNEHINKVARAAIARAEGRS